MSIRSRLLMLLAPMMMGFIILISVFLYINWYREIMDSFKNRIATVVVSVSELINPEDHNWLVENIEDQKTTESEIYHKYQHTLLKIKEKLNLTDLYTVIIESVKQGEKVLPNAPYDAKRNPVYDGKNSHFAFRERFIIDTHSNQDLFGQYDFSEANEQKLYVTKEMLITPIYQPRGGWGKMMSGFAPIIDKKGNVIAIVGADVSVEKIEKKIYQALLIIIFSAGITIVLVILGIFFVANKISRPVKHLKNSALAIAAGQYGQKIVIDGPQELIELANTLNTMGECLEETVVRLKENALTRERMYGEYECGLLLQKQMIEQVIKNYEHPLLEIRSIDIASTNLYGMFFEINNLPNGDVEMICAETQKKGFAAIYQLLSQKSNFKNFREPAPSPSLYLQISDDFSFLHGVLHGMPRPLIFSAEKQKLKVFTDSFLLKPGDFILLYNQGLSEVLENDETLRQWIGRVFRHFAKDGLSTCMAMLEKELQFILRKKNIDRDAHLICIHLKPTLSRSTGK